MILTVLKFRNRLLLVAMYLLEHSLENLLEPNLSLNSILHRCKIIIIWILIIAIKCLIDAILNLF